MRIRLAKLGVGPVRLGLGRRRIVHRRGIAQRDALKGVRQQRHRGGGHRVRRRARTTVASRWRDTGPWIFYEPPSLFWTVRGFSRISRTGYADYLAVPSTRRRFEDEIAGAQVAPGWHSADSSSRIRPAPPDARYLSKTSPYAFLRVPRSPKPPKRPARLPQLVPRRVRRLVRELGSRPFPRRSPRIRPRRAASSPPRPSSRSPRDAPSPFDAHAACGPLEPLPVTVHLPSPYPTRPDRRRETRPPRTRRRPRAAPNAPSPSSDNLAPFVPPPLARRTRESTRRRYEYESSRVDSYSDRDDDAPSNATSRAVSESSRVASTVRSRRFVSTIRSRRTTLSASLSSTLLRTSSRAARAPAPPRAVVAFAGSFARVSSGRRVSVVSAPSRFPGRRRGGFAQRIARREPRDDGATLPPSGLSGRWTSARRHSRAMVCAPRARRRSPRRTPRPIGARRALGRRRGRRA